MNTKYKVGDRVKIKNYGHKVWHNKDGQYYTQDIHPEMVGQKGVIVKAEMTQNIPSYAIDGIKGKHAWFDEEQIELI